MSMVTQCLLRRRCLGNFLQAELTSWIDLWTYEILMERSGFLERDFSTFGLRRIEGAKRGR
jgi:hypothetical protein